MSANFFTNFLVVGLAFEASFYVINAAKATSCSSIPCCEDEPPPTERDMVKESSIVGGCRAEGKEQEAA